MVIRLCREVRRPRLCGLAGNQRLFIASPPADRRSGLLPRPRPRRLPNPSNELEQLPQRLLQPPKTPELDLQHILPLPVRPNRNLLPDLPRKLVLKPSNVCTAFSTCRTDHPSRSIFRAIAVCRSGSSGSSARPWPMSSAPLDIASFTSSASSSKRSEFVTDGRDRPTALPISSCAKPNSS